MSLSDYDFDPEVRIWRRQGKCWVEEIDSDVFFPDLLAQGERMRRECKAKAICKQCEVQEACFEWAVRQGFEFGIYGGMTKTERNREMRRRRKAKRERIMI